MSLDHIINPALLQLTKQAGLGVTKQAFVPGGDPGMGGAPPGGDPAAGGGAPPPGGDPMAGGGGAPPPPGGGGGGGGDPMAALMPMIEQSVQKAMAASGGGAGGAGGAGGPGLKPKIDVNVEIMQIKNMLAKICDSLGVQIPAQDMVATPDKLNAMAQGGNPASGAQPGGGAGAGGAGGGGAVGAMPPMDPMQGAGTPGAEKMGSATSHRNGFSFDTSGMAANLDRAAAIRKIRGPV